MLSLSPDTPPFHPALSKDLTAAACSACQFHVVAVAQVSESGNRRTGVDVKKRIRRIMAI